MYGNNRFGGRGRGRGPSTPPVNVGDEVDVTIEAVGEKGDGVAKVNGFVLFVPGVKEGERIRVKVTKVLRKVGFAEKIGEAESAPPAPEETVSPEEVMSAPEPQQSYEDTEDFGEEPSEDASEESLEETPEETVDETEESFEESPDGLEEEKKEE